MQEKAKKNNKVIILAITFIVLFCFFLFMYFLPRDYEKEYSINKVDIKEKYSKKEAYYYFNMIYDNKNFEFANDVDYVTKRGLIENIQIIEEENITCLIPKAEKINTFPICLKNNEYVDYHLVDYDFKDFDKNIKKENFKYKDININYLNNKTYLIWNYNGFLYLNDDEKKTIEVLNKDTYNLDLVSIVNNYLLIPDFDSDYSFKKMYVLNIEKGKISEWDLEYEIYFDSYVLGVHDKSVFIFDKKNEVEYELRPDIEKMRKVKYKTLVDGEFERTTLAKLKNQLKFSYEYVYNYEVTNNKLYLTYLEGENKELVSEKEVDKIIEVDNDTVYYIVKEELYMFNKTYGEVLLMSYFEWNFNNNNMIYIY